MATTPAEPERLLQEIQVLSTEDRLRLIGRVLDSVLAPADRKEVHRPLQYGEFTGPNMSSEEDFQITEYRM